ncbi:hypothetical protein [Streptomyces sp. ALI-76-A]|jgi:hypothetical protein|uniref:hypothetical protein n=1 Tax=Streptomyces sp. ALI-76-A TaxID=3025736 RepID=UPI00256F0413|nr:hypothetical protein [Streptomyces sp. ALI-76-A]MDL5203158.1 hypothetical protein [Streptomyces sp. ALI-76-A]
MTRLGHVRVIVGGFALAVVAYGLFLPVGPDWPHPAMLPTLSLAGTAFAPAYGPLTIAATDGGHRHRAGPGGRAAQHRHAARLGDRDPGGDRRLRPGGR